MVPSVNVLARGTEAKQGAFRTDAEDLNSLPNIIIAGGSPVVELGMFL